jgi:ABC-type proline/glycine betaine transport system permease subunit
MITQAQGMFVFLVGIVITLLGVGGVESSITAAELTTAVLVAVTGLGCTACGTHMINRAAE